MKKLVMVLVTLISVTAVFAAPKVDTREEITKGLNSKKIEKGVVENATPENSVLIYGYVSDGFPKLWYKATKGDYEVTIESTFGDLCFPPVQKGTKLKLVQGGFWEYRNTYMGKKTIREEIWHEIEDFDEWNINVPAKASLYYMGYHSIRMPNSNTYEGAVEAWNHFRAEGSAVTIGGDLDRDYYEKHCAKFELKALKSLLKKYKGTAWEPLIQDRIKEVTPLTKKK